MISSLLIWGTQRKDLIKEKLQELNQTYYNKFLTLTGAALIAVFTSNILLLMMQTIRLEVSAFEAIQTSFGFTWMIRMAITIALLIVWFWLERKPNISKKNHFPILILSLALIGTSTMIGHGAASEQTAAMILDYAHNLIASIWIGGIIFFVFVLLSAFSRLDSDQRERLSLSAIPRFSIMIVISLGVLIITGPTLLWFLESDVGLLVESTYGMLILAKIGIASVMIVFGGYKQFRVQGRAEINLKAGTISVHKKLKRSLKIESALGIALLGVVALLTNGTLPAGEIQSVQAEQFTYGLQTVEFSENAIFDINIVPFSSGLNTISVIVTDLEKNPLQDLGTVKVKVSNPARSITPIEIPMNEISIDEDSSKFEGEITFGFSGKWLLEIEAQRTQNANEGVFIETVVKPRLSELNTEITEYVLPSTNSAPLYPVFDGKDSIWISDTGKPRIWKFSIEDQDFKSFDFEGKTSIVLTIDNDGKIWFTDTPESNIGFLDPATEKIEIIPLPMESIPIEIEADFENNIWIALTDKNMLVKYDQKTEKFEEHVIPTDPAGPYAVLRDSEGNIWFTETQSGKIGVIDPKTGNIKEFSSDEPLQAPDALFFDIDGNLWITEHTGLAITKFDPILETFEKHSVPDSDALPYGMAEDRYGNIWFAQHTVDNLAVYDPQNNNLIEVPIPTTTSFAQFVTSDNDQNVWFVEQRGNKLGVVKISETPSFGPLSEQIQKTEIKYTELVSPLISLGIIATSLFFVKSVRDKRRIDALLE